LMNIPFYGIIFKTNGGVKPKAASAKERFEMERAFYKTILVFLIFLLTGCTTVQKRPTDQLRNVDRPDATYEKDIRPFIIEQINNTAQTFFYDLKKFNRFLKEQGLPLKEGPVKNVIVGKNERNGICQDYASHFIDNYRGVGEVYFMSVDYNREAALQRRVKQFEKNDININDVKTVDSFIEEIYQWVINSKAKEEGASFKWQDKENQWTTFYTRTRNGTIYWTKDQSNYNPSIPFTKDLIKINMGNYQAARNRQKEKYINNIYNEIIHSNKNNKEFTNWGRSYKNYEKAGWHIEPLKFHTNKDGKLFLIEETSISTPLSHAGTTKKEDFFNHAWVRIIWRGRTFDIEPTWYDNGRPLEFGVIEEIIPGRVNTFPEAYSSFMELSNTRLIDVPMTATLRSGNSYNFKISSTDYSIFSIIINNNRNDFKKNDATGNHELINFKIPTGTESITIYGLTVSGNMWKAVGLIGYKVEGRGR